jgi:hypothetical protein
MQRWRVFTLAVVGLLMAATAQAVETDVGNFFVFDDLTVGDKLIDFDSDAAGNPLAAPCVFRDADTLNEQYAPMGVHFSGGAVEQGGAILNQCSSFQINAHSGTNFLAFNRNARTRTGDRATEPLAITFDSPVPSVSIYAAGGFAEQAFRLDAFGSHNRLLDTSLALTQGYQKLAVGSADGITKVVLSREAGARQVRVMASETSGNPGEAVTITLDVGDDARNVAGVSATLTYDTALTLPDVQQIAVGPLLSSGLREINADTPGSLIATAAAVQGGNGPGSLLEFPMTIAADAQPGRHPVSLSAVTLYDPQGNAIPTETVDGAVTVNAVTPPPPEEVCGDFTGDGKLNIQDATLALRMAVGIIAPTDAQVAAACGNTINVAFTTRILRAVVGLAPPPAPKM